MNDKKIIVSDAKSRLSDILVAISWREVARTYFGKSSSWLYHKLDGVKGDGSDGGFTQAETVQLKGALEDLAKRITAAASKL
ncbi:DUF5053 domain-containing protein [uncultured Duncaniella sp.]|uniref:DUF5053 domain-containing protein n=1 Tax=uncultured Duncaniella sp. TaxID=2768039 RepID=UPI0025AA2867|nr:DUF5053 domain-containing protein [uncultured Duncaniella sp.]